MARRRFFVDEFHNHRAEVSGDDAHHLTRVLRVERGQQYEVCDNSAAWLATVIEAHKSRVVFELKEPIAFKPTLAPLTLYVALFKFDHLEWIIEKGTELGVENFHFVIAERSERGLERAAEKRIERWRKIALEASQQSRRDHLPLLHEPVRLREAAKQQEGANLLLDEEGGAPLLSVLSSQGQSGSGVNLMTGPEGGWVDHERELLRQSGWTAVTLGPSILRAETAAIAAIAVVQSSFLTSSVIDAQ
ncbi:MAG: RsmE family RNA methyltransferase [Acidobacteriota bacterium]